MAYFIHLAILVCVYSMLGLSLNLVVGYTGLLSVAEAAFYGIGAYVTALLLVNSGWNFFLAIAATDRPQSNSSTPVAPEGYRPAMGQKFRQRLPWALPTKNR